jgi:low affinity Fe/Cu permease
LRSSLLLIARWLVSEPYFHYSDTLAALHQYRTTVVTLLSEAGRPRHSSDLDEIIKSIDQAQNEMIDIEHLSDDELQKFADKYQKVRVEWDNRSRRRKQKD